MSQLNGDLQSGRVKWFNSAKGFGFIVPDDGSSDVFVHINDLPDGVDELAEDRAVRFSTEETKKGLKAVGVALV